MSETIMIDLNYIYALEWTPTLGRRLKMYRGKKSTVKLAKEIDFKSPQKIIDLESAKVKSVKPADLQAICIAIGKNIADFYPLHIHKTPD